jgi:hypothetical protein
MSSNKQLLKQNDDEHQLAYEAINNLLIKERLHHMDVERENGEIKSDYTKLASKYEELLDKMSEIPKK